MRTPTPGLVWDSIASSLAQEKSLFYNTKLFDCWGLSFGNLPVNRVWWGTDGNRKHGKPPGGDNHSILPPASPQRHWGPRLAPGLGGQRGRPGPGGCCGEGCGALGAGPVAGAQRRRRGPAGMPSIPGVPGTSGPDSSELVPALLHPRRPVNQHPPLKPPAPPVPEAPPAPGADRGGPCR